MKKFICILLCSWLSAVVGFSQAKVGEVEKMATFCKVWGFLKYYHPQVTQGKLNWDQEFISGIKSLDHLHTKQEISGFYTTWIESLGLVPVCTICKNDIPDSLRFNLNLGWLTDTLLFTPDLVQKLEFIKNNRAQGFNYYVQQQPGIGNTLYTNEEPYKDSIFPSRELRLLGLARYWNVINYFFPYKYVIGEDWNMVLDEMIPVFRDAPDTVSYHMGMLELVARINDSHGYFSSDYTQQYFGLKYVPFFFRIIDQKAMVKKISNDSLARLDDIRLHDVFLSVNHVDIKDIIQKNYKYIPASNDATKLRNMFLHIFNGNEDSVHVTFERNGTVMEKYIHRYPFSTVGYTYTKPAADTTHAWKVMKGNIGYVHMGLLEPEQVHQMIRDLKKTRAIIFDVRNYPNGTMYTIADFLNPEKVPFVIFTTPDMDYPGAYKYTAPYTCGKKNKHAYSGQVVLLCNETTQSHAEFTLMALETAPKATIVGSQTAGADGNVSYLVFPGSYTSVMTGIGVYYPDGKPTQRIGIVPDVVVKPTIEGIRSGRDEVLEKAIDLVNGKK